MNIQSVTLLLKVSKRQLHYLKLSILNALSKDFCTVMQKNHVIMHAPINDLPHSPHAGKGGDRLGIYLLVVVMTLPLGPIYWVNPHIYFVRVERKQNIRVYSTRDYRIYLSLKCSPHSKKRPRMYRLSTQLAPLGTGKSPLVWAIISGQTPPKPRVLPAWGGVGQVIDRCITCDRMRTVLDPVCSNQSVMENFEVASQLAYLYASEYNNSHETTLSAAPCECYSML